LRSTSRYTRWSATRPEVLEAVPRASYIASMVKKYRSGVIDNVVAYREVSKMARSEHAGIDRSEVIPVLIKLAKEKKYSIDQAYKETVQSAYDRRDLIHQARRHRGEAAGVPQRCPAY